MVRRLSSILGVCPAQRLRANSGCSLQSGVVHHRTRRVRSRLSGRRLCFPTTRNAETVKNHARSVRAIESIEMNSGHVVIQKVVTLLQREVNANTLNHFLIVFAPLDGPQKSRREPSATGELSDPPQPAHGGNWHDAGDNRDVDVRQRTTLTKIQEVAVLIE